MSEFIAANFWGRDLFELPFQPSFLPRGLPWLSLQGWWPLREETHQPFQILRGRSQ
jgi:hypothetical protein